MVLVHGYTASHAMWAPQFPALGREYRTLAYDVRGHGDSARTYNGHTMDALVRDLASFLDEVGVERAHLAGVSMGGMIVQRFCLKHPRRAATITVADSFPGRIDKSLVETFLYHAKLMQSHGLGALFNYLLNNPALPVGPDFSVPLELMGMYQDNFMKNDPMSLAGFTQMFTAMRDWSEDLRDVRCPALLIAGDQDAPCIGPMESMSRVIPHSEYHVIGRCGHASNLEKPEEFNRLLLDFLGRHPM